MAQFDFVALDPAGRTKRGVMEAGDRQAVIDQLQRQGDIPVRATPANGSGASIRHLISADFAVRRGLGRGEVASFTRELVTMLSAGQDLDRALRFLTETASGPRVRAVLEDLREQVRGGASLTQALGAHGESFPRLYTGLVRAGEAGGTLVPTLERLAELLDRERALASAIISAMIYPAILGLAAIGAVVLLLTYVLPQFVPMFEDSGAKLPAATQFLIDTGSFLSAWGLYILLGLLATGLILRQALREPGFKHAVDSGLLRLPVVAPLIREALAASFTRIAGTLLQNGVPMIQALAITREAFTNLVAVAAIEAASDAARSGAGLAKALARAEIFPTRTTHLLQLGEETGQLAAMALRAAEIHEASVRLRLERLVALLVPAITLTMGALVGGIVAALMLAMLSLNDLAA